MKKYLIAIVVLFSTIITSSAKDKIIPINELPQNIVEYVAEHFPIQKIIQAKKDIETNDFSFELVLDNATKLEFTKSGQILEIKSKSKLPDSVVPNEILNYVKQNFSTQFIIEWELKRRKQEIELNNGLELEFDLNGNFIKID